MIAQGLQSSVNRKCWAKCDFLAAFVKDLATMTMIDALNLNHLGQPPVQVQAPPPATAEQVEVSAVQDSTPIFEVDDEAPFAPTSPTYSPTSPTYGTMPQISQQIPNRRRRSAPPSHAGLQTRSHRSAIPGPHQKADRSLQKSGEPSRNAPFEWVFHRDGSQRAPVRHAQVQQAQESLRLHASKFGQVFVPPRMANSQRLQEFNNMSRPYVSSEIFARDGFTWVIGV